MRAIAPGTLTKTTGVRGVLLAAAVLLFAAPVQAQVTATLTVGSTTLVEGGSSVTITAGINGTTTGAAQMTMSFTNVTAESGDYATQGGTTTFLFGAGTGSRTETTTIFAQQDTDFDDETFTISASVAGGGSGVTFTAIPDINMTIDDDDVQPVTLALTLTPTSIGEGRTSTVSARVTGGTTTAATTITVSTVAGSAESGDWTQSGTTLNIAAGATTSTGTVTITAVADTDADNETVSVRGVAVNTTDNPSNPANQTLTITEPNLVTIAVELTPTSQREGLNSSVTARVTSGTTTAATTLTISSTAGTAESTDWSQSGTTLTIASGASASTGTVTITTNTDTDFDNETVTVSAAASANNADTITVNNATLTITEPPRVELVLTPSTITEGGTAATVTARIVAGTGTTTAATAITVSAAAVSPTVAGDFTLTGSALSIAAGATTSTGTVTITANQDVDTASEMVTVSATASNSTDGIQNPSAVTLNISDDDAAPTVELVLTPSTITEGGSTNSSTITARIATGTTTAETRVTVSATAVSPTVAADFTLSTNPVLLIAAGATTSTGVVTVTSVQDTDTTNEQVTISATVVNTADGLDPPQSQTLTITDDDGTGAAPVVELQVSPNPITEGGPSANVTARVASGTTTVATTITVTAAAVSPTVAGDFTLTGSTLTIDAGQAASSGTVTIAANQDTDQTNETVTVSATVANTADNIAAPSNVTLTITDDDTGGGGGGGTAPGTPTNLTATAGDGQVTLMWQTPSGTITAWHYEQNGAWMPIPNSGASTTSFVVTGLTNGTQYTFRVVARNGMVSSEASNTASATPMAATVPAPGTPASLTATAGDGRVTLAWQTPTGTVTAWHYEQNNVWMPVPGSGASTTSFVVTGLTNGTEYTFRVVALNGTARSEASNTASATPMAPTVPAPGTPSSLTVTAGDGQVTLAWQMPSGTVTSFHYEQNNVWMPIPGSGPSTTSFVVTGLTNGTQYSFRVAALNGTARSEASNAASATPMAATLPAPGTPTSLTATAGDGRVALAWRTPSGTITAWHYEQNNVWMPIPDSGPNTTAFVVTGLTNGTQYTFRVAALNGMARSEASNTASATPMAGAMPVPALPLPALGLLAAGLLAGAARALRRRRC